MLLAAQSLSALKNSPPAPNTPFLLRVSGPSNLAPFTMTHSSYAKSSPTTRVDTVGLPTAPASPTLPRKVYRATKKSRSVTQLILMDAGSHTVANPSAPIEVAGSTMPPPEL